MPTPLHPARSELRWLCRDRVLLCGGRTLIMGVLNVTPDSFSDGGQFNDFEAARRRAVEMAEAGADIIDVGGESTRPGSQPVSLDEETQRVVPVIEAIRDAVPEVAISVDTSKAGVARRALDVGADIVNDVTAFVGDSDMAAAAAEWRAGVVLMHMQGRPANMQVNPEYCNVVDEVEAYLRERIEAVCAAGVERERICIDPGIGFGKTVEHNLRLMAAGARLRALGAPVLVGASRKSTIGKLIDRPVDRRLEGSLGAAVAASLLGADIVRVHDVAETRLALQVSDAIRRNACQGESEA